MNFPLSGKETVNKVLDSSSFSLHSPTTLQNTSLTDSIIPASLTISRPQSKKQCPGRETMLPSLQLQKPQGWTAVFSSLSQHSKSEDSLGAKEQNTNVLGTNLLNTKRDIRIFAVISKYDNEKTLCFPRFSGLQEKVSETEGFYLHSFVLPDSYAWSPSIQSCCACFSIGKSSYLKLCIWRVGLRSILTRSSSSYILR